MIDHSTGMIEVLMGMIKGISDADRRLEGEDDVKDEPS